MKKTMIVLGCIVFAIALVAGVFALIMSNGMSVTENLKIDAVNVSALADGTYEGDYDAGRFANKVSVTVQGGRITGIDIKKTVQFEKPEVTKALVDSVIARQDTDVDAQSGATITSKAYLKAIENALGGK